MNRLCGKATRALAAIGVLLLAGCSEGIGGIGAGALPYQHSNAIMNAGYSETLVGPDRYRIQVKGPLNTPRERLEMIAATRAAEIGKDNRLKYFKIEGFEHAASCQQYIQGGQRGGAGAQKKQTGFAVLNANVAYAKDTTDPSYMDSKTAFDQYRSQLDQAPAAPSLPAVPATAQCG
jgi:hypothetical protein